MDPIYSAPPSKQLQSSFDAGSRLVFGLIDEVMMLWVVVGVGLALWCGGVGFFIHCL